MNQIKLLEILHSIATACFGSALNTESLLANQVNETSWAQKLSLALREELIVEITAQELESSGSLLGLSQLLETRLDRDSTGRSVVEIYTALEQIVREELPHDINYHTGTAVGEVICSIIKTALKMLR